MLNRFVFGASIAAVFATWAAAQSDGVSIAGLGQGERFRECEACPLMSVVDGGDLVLGAGGEFSERRVVVSSFAIAVSEVTRAEFERFIDATGHSIGLNCDDGSPAMSWLDPGFAQTGSHPVVCVSFEDAQAYVAWLNTQVDGAPYRLPSEAEFELALRTDNALDAYPWGSAQDKACRYGNVADVVALEVFPSWFTTACDDGFAYTAPVATFAPNGLGLYDMSGNVSEWVLDCWIDSHVSGPSDGSAQLGGDCTLAVVRGGSWSTVPEGLRAFDRGADSRSARFSDLGFRVARSLDP